MKDGCNRRKNLPDMQMLECKNCGRNFCLRVNTIFYWKHSSAGELFMIAWIFYGFGNRRWPGEWISNVGKWALTDWFERLEKAMIRAAGAANAFIDGLFQADEMMIRSFGEKLWIFGVKRSDGKVFKVPLRGYSILEFNSALRESEEELGPIVCLDTDAHSSYPEATRWLGIMHRSVNRSREGFVNDAGVHSNGVENMWSHDRNWIEAARGYGSLKTLKRAVKAHQVYQNQVKESPVPVWSFLDLLITN